VYWSHGQVSPLWLELRVQSYYQILQAQGLLFSRRTAQEARRRAVVIGPFELERMRRERDFWAAEYLEKLEGFHGDGTRHDVPGREDLQRLCREEGLDYAVLRHDFGGQYAATNGRLFIYDCKRLRGAEPAALTAAPPAPAP
jgi:hypothetical protein